MCTFYNCEKLEEIILPEGLEELEFEAFKNCPLKEVKLPQNLKTYGTRVFDTHVKIKNTSDYVIVNGILVVYKGQDRILQILEEVVEIGDTAFEGCTGIQEVKMSDNVVRIGNAAFKGCTSLTKIELSNGLKEIGSGTFRSCSDLKSICLSQSVEKLGNILFYDCKKLFWVTCSSDIKEMGEQIFDKCSEGLCVIVDDKYIYVDKGTTPLGELGRKENE